MQDFNDNQKISPTMEDKCKAHVADIAIPFPTRRLAEIAYDALRVDIEPKRGGVSKDISIENHILHVSYSADVAKQLRVAVNSFFDNLILITKTVDCLGNPSSVRYSHY